MGPRWAAGLIGSFATLYFYAMLFFVQIANADNACESYPATVPGASHEDVWGIGFENSFLNLGGACTYHVKDGSVVHAREPGWGFSGTIGGVVAALAVAVALLARWKGRSAWVHGLTAFVAPPLGLALAPPLGLALAVSAPRRGLDRTPP